MICFGSHCSVRFAYIGFNENLLDHLYVQIVKKQIAQLNWVTFFASLAVDLPDEVPLHVLQISTIIVLCGAPLFAKAMSF